MANINWEKRAKERRLETKRLNKKIKELTISREFWKKRAMERKENIDELNYKFSILKKNIQKIQTL
jgi:hypothetical protein